MDVPVVAAAGFERYIHYASADVGQIAPATEKCAVGVWFSLGPLAIVIVNIASKMIAIIFIHLFPNKLRIVIGQVLFRPVIALRSHGEIIFFQK